MPSARAGVTPGHLRSHGVSLRCRRSAAAGIRLRSGSFMPDLSLGFRVLGSANTSWRLSQTFPFKAFPFLVADALRLTFLPGKFLNPFYLPFYLFNPFNLVLYTFLPFLLFYLLSLLPFHPLTLFTLLPFNLLIYSVYPFYPFNPSNLTVSTF